MEGSAKDVECGAETLESRKETGRIRSASG